MRAILFFLIGLACVGHGRRVQKAFEIARSDDPLVDSKQASSLRQKIRLKPLKIFSSLLLQLNSAASMGGNPAAAFLRSPRHALAATDEKGPPVTYSTGAHSLGEHHARLRRKHLIESLIVGAAFEAFVISMELAKPFFKRMIKKYAKILQPPLKAVKTMLQRLSKAAQKVLDSVIPEKCRVPLSKVTKVVASACVAVLAGLMRYGPTLLRLLFHSISISPCYLGPAVKVAMEKLDRRILGVDLTASRIRVNPFVGKVVLWDLKVHNPPGYQSEYLLQMEKVGITLNVGKFVRSQLRSLFTGEPANVLVKHFVFRNCQTMVEKHNFKESNIKQVLDHLDKPDKPPPPPGSQEVTIEKVKILNTGVRFQVEGKVFGHESNLGFDLAVADLVEENFSAVHGTKAATEMFAVILKTFLKSIATTVAGKRIGSHMF